VVVEKRTKLRNDKNRVYQNAWHMEGQQKALAILFPFQSLHSVLSYQYLFLPRTTLEELFLMK
jgi:hypothetical protein